MLRRIKGKIVIAIALLVGLYLLQRGGLVDFRSEKQCSVAGEVEATIHEMGLKYGIQIRYDATEKAIPELWRIPPSNATAEPILRVNLCRHIHTLSLELKKYPPAILKRDLSTIYLLNTLSFYGVQYGGTSLNGSIYLTGGSKSEGYTDAYFATLLHHEMSSIFFSAYPFPTEDWSSINPENFHYAESDRQVLEAISKGDERSNAERLFREGFLSEYGLSTIENDFNLFAEMAFTHPQELKRLAEKHPKIRQKAELLKKFYTGISKDFLIND